MSCFSGSCPISSRSGTQLGFFPLQQLQASHPEMFPQNPAPAVRKKSQEKKSNLKRVFSLKKHGSEESKRMEAADVSSPERRPSRKISFLPLCVGGHRPSISSSPGEQAHSYYSNTAAASSSASFPRAGIGRFKSCHPSPDLCSSLSNGEKTVGRRKGEASRWPPHTKPHLTV